MKKKVIAIFAFLVLGLLVVFFPQESSISQNKIRGDRKNIEENINEITLKVTEWVEETSENVMILFPGDVGIEKEAKKFKVRAIALEKELLACKNNKERLTISEEIRKLAEDFETFKERCKKEFMNGDERELKEIKDRTVFLI